MRKICPPPPLHAPTLVGVVLQRQLSMRLLELVLRRRRGHAQDLVVPARERHAASFNTPMPARRAARRCLGGAVRGLQATFEPHLEELPLGLRGMPIPSGIPPPKKPPAMEGNGAEVGRHKAHARWSPWDPRSLEASSSARPGSHASNARCHGTSHAARQPPIYLQTWLLRARTAELKLFANGHGLLPGLLLASLLNGNNR